MSTSGVIDWDHFTSRVQRVFFVILQICLAISNIAIFFSSSAGSCWPSNIALFFGFSGCGGRRRKKNKIMIYFRFPHRRIHPSLLAHHPSPSCRLDGFPSTRTAGSSYSKNLFLFFHFSFFLGDFSLFLFVSSPSSLVDFFCFSYADKFSTFLISLSFTINKRHIPHREFLFLSIPFHNSIEISLISRDCGL